MSLQSQSPSCHDGVTMTCPVCQRTFSRSGRQTYCSEGCRAAAYRRRRDAGRVAVTVPKAQPRRPVTVYECEICGERAVGEQRCESCARFMTRVGIGGLCPSCDEPIAVTELVGQYVAALGDGPKSAPAREAPGRSGSTSTGGLS